jgi:hypothetical protein
MRRRDTGKAGVRAGVLAALRASLAAKQPELVLPVFDVQTGANALGNAQAASMGALTTLFAESPSYLVAGAGIRAASARMRAWAGLPAPPMRGRELGR